MSKRDGEKVRDMLDKYIAFIEQNKNRKPKALHLTGKQIKDLLSIHSQYDPIHTTKMYQGIKIIETGK